MALDPDDGQPLLDAGWAAYKRGDYQRAIQALRQAASTLQKPDLAHYRLGFCFRSLQQHNEAVRHFRRAAELDSKNAWSQYQVGKEFALSGAFRAALPEFARAIDRDCLLAITYCDAAACLGTLGHSEPATVSYTVCSFACEVAQYDTGVPLQLLERSLLQLMALVGPNAYHEIRARVWREFGMMRYPVPEDQIRLDGFRVVGKEVADALRSHGADERWLRSLFRL